MHLASSPPSKISVANTNSDLNFLSFRISWIQNLLNEYAEINNTFSTWPHHQTASLNYATVIVSRNGVRQPKYPGKYLRKLMVTSILLHYSRKNTTVTEPTTTGILKAYLFCCLLLRIFLQTWNAAIADATASRRRRYCHKSILNDNFPSNCDGAQLLNANGRHVF